MRDRLGIKGCWRGVALGRGGGGGGHHPRVLARFSESVLEWLCPVVMPVPEYGAKAAAMAVNLTCVSGTSIVV